jgi:hypothetical protein
VPHGIWWWEEIHAHRATLMMEEHASLQWDLLNDAVSWQAFF